MVILNYISSLSRRRRVWAIGSVISLGLAIAPGNRVSAAWLDQAFDEYQVKAAFLYNFAKFVKWPNGTFQSLTDPIAICVLGPNPFGRSLRDTVAGRVIEGRPMVVRQIAKVREVAGCQVLFVSSSEDFRSVLHVSDVKEIGILTIGDSGSSTADEVVIRFKLVDGKVRFEINMAIAEHQNLWISSRLLSLAQVVEPRRE